MFIPPPIKVAVVGDDKAPGTVFDLVQTSFFPIFLQMRGFLAVPDRVPIFVHDDPTPAAKTVSVGIDNENMSAAIIVQDRTALFLIRALYDRLVRMKDSSQMASDPDTASLERELMRLLEQEK
jgi:hypothetical protein